MSAYDNPAGKSGSIKNPIPAMAGSIHRYRPSVHTFRPTIASLAVILVLAYLELRARRVYQ